MRIGDGPIDKLRALALVPGAAVLLLRARRDRSGSLALLQGGEVAPKAMPSASEQSVARRIGRAVTLAARALPLRIDCVTKAGAARLLLADHGIASEAVFGARPDPVRGIEGHVWLRCGEVTIGESDDPELVPFRRAAP